MVLKRYEKISYTVNGCRPGLHFGARLAALFILALLLVLCGSCSKSGPREAMIEHTLQIYRSMKPGDWAIYYLDDNNGSMLRVREIDKKSVIIVRQSYFFGSPAMGNFALEYRFDDIKRNMKSGLDLSGKMPVSEPVITKERVVSAGRTYDCTVYTVNIPDAKVSTYISDQAMVDGVVMVIRNGVVIRRLIASGSKEDPLIIPAFL